MRSFVDRLLASRISRRRWLGGAGRCVPIALGSCLLAGTVAAQPAGDTWRVRFDAGALHQWETDIDDGGEFEVDAWGVRIGADRAFGDGLRSGLAGGYGERRYRFDGGKADFGGTGPWADVRSVRLSAPVSWKADERWNLFAVPTVRWMAEEGADLDDGRIGGLLAAATYRVSDRLSLGPGFGVFSEIEDDTDWFPILAIDWRLTDTLTLRTGRGLAASRGPGLSLDWTPSERWELSLGARYQKERFRLDDRGIASGGVGQQTSFPLYLGATRSFGPHLNLRFTAGLEFGGELRLEDAGGGLIDETDYDTAPFGGATLDLSF
jgi:hypothetical protein